MSKRSQSTSLPQAALQLTGVSLLSQFLYFLYQAALSHIVGTEGLGLVHMVLPIYYTLLAFLTSGFALAISKLCSEYQSRTQSRGLTVIVSNTLFLFLVTLLLVALLFWLAYRTFANRWLAELPLGGYVLVLPLLLFFTGLEIFNKHYFYGINVVHILRSSNHRTNRSDHRRFGAAAAHSAKLSPASRSPSSCWECWSARSIPPST